MNKDERTPLRKQQDRVRALQDEEARLLQRLQEVRQEIGRLSLQITGLA
jgi:hypothetical protein